MAEGSPINDIIQMRQQGLSNNQIIQNLQRTGYSNTQIFDAMNHADTKMAVEGFQPGVLTHAPEEQLFTQPAPGAQAVDMGQGQIHEEPSSNTVSQIMGADFSSGAMNMDSPKVEELVEAIIEEKWSELVKDVSKIVDWKNRMENKISEMEITLKNIKENFSDLNRSVLGKVNDYDKHIQEVGADIKAMEKVFSKVLPKFTENVNELSRITDKLR